MIMSKSILEITQVRDSSRSPLLVDVIIHKETIVAMGAADDNIRSEHWHELAAAIAGLMEIPGLARYVP